MSKDSVFQQDLIQYLESAHKGEFITSSMDSIRQRVPTQIESHGGIHAVIKDEQAEYPCATEVNYKDPTLILPVPAPLRCNAATDCKCRSCKHNEGWWIDYYNSVDDLLLKSNIHRCTASSAIRQSLAPTTNTLKTAKQGPKGCLDRDGICRARFP
jgi:hypothetical protein